MVFGINTRMRCIKSSLRGRKTCKKKIRRRKWFCVGGVASIAHPNGFLIAHYALRITDRLRRRVCIKLGFILGIFIFSLCRANILNTTATTILQYLSFFFFFIVLVNLQRLRCTGVTIVCSMVYLFKVGTAVPSKRL